MTHLWIITYDISDAKIRHTISKHLENHGQRVQYSVFECRLTREQQQKLRQTLQQHIETWDKIRYYPLCKHCENTITWQGNGQSVQTHDYYLL